MGCDIHWTVEVKSGDKWIGVMNDCGSKCKAADRWYAFFGELVGVRMESDSAMPQRGLPEDVSDLTRYDAHTSSWDHSASWCGIEEFVAAYNRAVTKFQYKNPDGKVVSKEELFGLSYWPINDDEEQRIVFAFDN